MMRTITLDEGWATTAQAEHGALARVSELGLSIVLACTHFRPAEGSRPPRVTVTLYLGEPGDDLTGRAFSFPGMAELERVVTVETLLSRTAVDDVVLLGGIAAAGSDRVDTQNFLRPEFSADRLVLRVRPSAGGDLVPFEQPHPTPCCAEHG